MLESKIVAMLFGGMSQKSANYKIKFISNYNVVPLKLQGSCTWGYHNDHAYGKIMSMPIISISTLDVFVWGRTVQSTSLHLGA